MPKMGVDQVLCTALSAVFLMPKLLAQSGKVTAETIHATFLKKIISSGFVTYRSVFFFSCNAGDIITGSPTAAFHFMQAEVRGMKR